jgi:hypothetical protein
MTIPTIEQLEQQKRDAHYALSNKLGALNDEMQKIQARLKEIQDEAQELQSNHVVEDAKRDAQIELLTALEAEKKK